jgi:DNA-binding GntR family transcriptional regulator
MPTHSRTPKQRLANQSEVAYRLISEKIFRGQLPLGTPVSRRGLAAQLGLGLLPVTEALQRLENDGLVESLPRVGTRIRLPTPMEVRGHYIVREALEAQAARLFAEQASQDDRTELRHMAAELDAVFAHCEQLQKDTPNWEQHWYEVHRRHARFHMHLTECTRCQPLCAALEKNQILVFHWLFDVAAGPEFLPPNFHAELMEYVGSRDVEAADAAMRRHVRNGMRDILRRMAGTGPSVEFLREKVSSAS